MLAKKWKKILMVILIIMCSVNIMSKILNKISLNKEMSYSATYMLEEEKDTQTK